ncbi:unnamed protein product, partial [Polarella glacialis]
SRLPQVPQVKPVTVCFGLGAFVETLCRVVFMYLLVNGNASQLAMTSQARMGWLIAYLRAILLLNRDQSKGQQPKQQEQLQQEEQQQQQPLQDNNRAQLTGLAQESSETVNPAAEQTTTTIPTTTAATRTTTATPTTTTTTVERLNQILDRVESSSMLRFDPACQPLSQKPVEEKPKDTTRKLDVASVAAEAFKTVTKRDARQQAFRSRTLNPND